jgi:glycosyltransferase involved in cell wall biosynthesis
VKVALVHDWINGLRGGERVLEQFLTLYPNADIFTLFHTPGRTSEKIDSRVKHVSFLNAFPGASRLYRGMLPLFPLAISRFRFEGYDLVISLSHAAAKNVTVPSHIPHISYCFTPMRYIWDQASTYLGALTPLAWPLIALLRRWDRRGAERVGHFVGISKFVSARIRCFYGKKASVIFPPVETSWIHPRKEGTKGKAFLVAGALVPYKRVEIAIRACESLGKDLWIVGDGPQREKLEQIAGPHTHFFGRVSDGELAQMYKGCRALLFPGIEDFGMIPVECMAAGRPVIGCGIGGLGETVKGIPVGSSSSLELDRYTGVFCREGSTTAPTVEEFSEAIRFFLKNEERFSAARCVEVSKRFSPSVFMKQWEQLTTSLGITGAEGKAAAV